MNKPLVSIIVPAYNAENYLESCIDSILQQTFIDFELLIVNDGSKDTTASLCDRYMHDDKRVKVFHKKNGGVSSARNLGLDNAKGEWICFVDSDDSVDPFWLEEYVNALTNTDLVFQGAVLIDKGVCQKVILRECFVQGGEREEVLSYLEDVRGALLNSTWSKCYKSSIIRSNGIKFMEKCSLSEDLIFTIQFLMASHSFRVLKYTGYNYRRDNSTLTRAKQEPESLLYWKKSIFEPLTILCAENKNSPLYRSIATREFSYVSYYMICNVRNMKKDVKESYYRFLNNLRTCVSIKLLPANRLVFLFSFLPRPFFDYILMNYSSIYLWLKGVINKKSYV